MGCIFSREIGGGHGPAPVTSTPNVFARWRKSDTFSLSESEQSQDSDDEDAYVIDMVRGEGDTEESVGLRGSPRETLKVNTSRDASGNKIVNEYVILKTLGAGSYGKVKLCINLLDEQFYAIKIFHKGMLRRKRIGMSTALQDVVREIAIMKKLRHRNIVRLFEIINDSQDERLYMVMEFVAGGPILDLEDPNIEPLDEDLARKYFKDIISGLRYLHKQQIIHRDIKPENLLVSDSGVVKITDFGVSHVFDKDDTLSRSAGSPAFLAPELCTAGATASGRAVDVWACGVTLYCMVFASVPFIAESIMEIYEVIRNQPLQFPEGATPELCDLLCRMLDKNPDTRITLGKVRKHPWYRHTALPPPNTLAPPPQDTGAKMGSSKSFEDFSSDSECSTISLSQTDINNAVSNSFVSLGRFKSRMKDLSSKARTRLTERMMQLPSWSPTDLSDTTSESDSSTVTEGLTAPENMNAVTDEAIQQELSQAEAAMRSFSSSSRTAEEGEGGTTSPEEMSGVKGKVGPFKETEDSGSDSDHETIPMSESFETLGGEEETEVEATTKNEMPEDTEEIDLLQKEVAQLVKEGVPLELLLHCGDEEVGVGTGKSHPGDPFGQHHYPGMEALIESLPVEQGADDTMDTITCADLQEDVSDDEAV